MSSSGSSTLIVIERGRSRLLAALILVPAGLALVALALLPPGWAMAAGVVLGVGILVELRRVRGTGRIEWHADGSWQVASPRGRWRGRLAPGSFVSPWIIVLALRGPGWFPRRLVLARDAIQTTTWRRLQVRLRTSPEPFARDRVA